MKKKFIVILLIGLFLIIAGCGVKKETPTETAKSFIKGLIQADEKIISETYKQEDYFSPEDILSSASNWNLDELDLDDFTYKVKDKLVYVYYVDSNKEKHTIALEMFKVKEGYRIDYFKHANGHVSLDGAKTASKDNEGKVKNEQAEYTFPKTDFDAYDEVLFENENGKVRFIGHTFYKFEDEMEDHALLALKYEGDFSTEWKDTAITVKPIYSDGSSQWQIVGFSNDADDVDSRLVYTEGKDTIVVYNLGEIENKKKLVRMDYAMGKDKEAELKTLTLESKKKIKLLGLNKLPNSLIKDAPYVMENKDKKVSISSITYNDETKVIGVKGKITFNEDISKTFDYGYLYVPSQRKTVGANLETDSSSFFKGIGQTFETTFKLDQNLSKQDKQISLFLYGLGVTIDLSKADVEAKGDSSFLYGYLNGEVRRSNINGLIDGNGNIHHNSIAIDTDYGHFNSIQEKSRVYSFTPFLIGNMYKNVKLNLAIEKMNGNYAPLSTEEMTITFYSYQNPIQWGNTYDMSNNEFPSEIIKEKVPDLKLNIAEPKLTIIKTVTLAPGEIEKKNIELNLNGTEMLGVCVDSPVYRTTDEYFESTTGKSIILYDFKLVKE